MKDELKELIADVNEQVVYLRELGVESFDVKFPEAQPSRAAHSSTVESEPSVVEPTPVFSPPPKPVIASPPEARKTRSGSRIAALPRLTRRGSSAPNVDLTTIQEPEMHLKTAAVEITVTDDALFGDISGLPESIETVQDVWADIGNCTRCPLHEGRTQIVQTVGNYQSDLMFVGEAPGADEDSKGEPFVGRAGQLLNKIIEAIGMKREDVCIGNINRCRPPGNRQPTLPEAHTCRPFLLREIAVIRPKVIVVMGNTALHNLLDTKIGITRMRGQFHDYFGVKVMPTFHPAYLLRDPSKKREVWDDMKKVRDYLTSLTK